MAIANIVSVETASLLLDMFFRLNLRKRDTFIFHVYIVIQHTTYAKSEGSKSL
jgi:hypothetical protein